MTWFAIDTDLPGHPKWRALSLEAKVTWIELGCHAAKYLTDGHVLEQVASSWSAAAVQELEQKGWLHPQGNGDGWVLHDFLDYNLSRAQVAERHRKKVEAGRKGAAAQRLFTP